MTEKTKKWINRLLAVLVMAGTVWLTVFYWPEIYRFITEKEVRDAFISYVQEHPFPGIPIFLGMQILQMVVAVLPGEPIEICAGLLFGIWGGFFLCMVGLLLGTMLIYYTVKAFGAKSWDDKKLGKYAFLRKPQKINMLLFLLFFIPGTPKDMLLYAGPFLPVKPLHFFLLSTLARIPSVLTSTYAAGAAVQGNWVSAVVVFVITGVVGLLCVLFQERITGAIHHLRKEKHR